jgi:tetratricopeptide (TPR) repeat protein
MTMTLVHPAAEDLGRFVEGTLDDAGRATVVTHIADCDECRILVVDAAEFVEPAAEVRRHRWVGIAAAAVLLVGMGTLATPEYRNRAIGWLLDQINFSNSFTYRMARVTASYGGLKKRPIEGRLSGLPYRPYIVMRGASEEEEPPELLILKGDAAGLAELRGNDPKILHARGVGLLLEGNATESLAPLTAAATREPQNAGYQNDVTAALITAWSHDPGKLQQALLSADRAVQLDPKSPEALFNRGEVLELLTRTREAIATYERYLRVDSTSPGADEVRKHLERLQTP